MDDWSWDAMITTARNARGDDPRGERAELITLMEAARGHAETDPAPRNGVGR